MDETARPEDAPTPDGAAGTTDELQGAGLAEVEQARLLVSLRAAGAAA